MKNLFLIMLLLISSIFNSQNYDKPRYFKNAAVLCPIDISKSFDKEGLIRANKNSIKIDSIKYLQPIKGAGKDKGVEILVDKTIVDTILTKSLVIDKGPAFDVIMRVGSFSIIRLWLLSDVHAKGLLRKLHTEYTKFTNKNEEYPPLEIDSVFSNLRIVDLLATDGNNTFDLTKNCHILPTKDLLQNSIEFENKTNKWNIGLLILPIKTRPFATESGQFDFSNGFSVGTTFAWTVHHNWKSNFSHNFLVYAGVSSFKVDESKIKEVREDYTLSAFSPGIGWMLEKNNIQVSLLTGIDFPAGAIQKKWVYRNMPWIGIGLGISLFKIESEAQTTSGKN